jgi:glucose-1-phosphate cytidylyltransferase
LQEHTQAIPKPLVEIGGMPIVWHVIQLYAVHGFRSFWLATGYRGELIESFVAEHTWPQAIEVRCVQTGLDTPTGGRVKLMQPHLESAGQGYEQVGLCVTYADGLADIDLAALWAFHRSHGATGTITVVRPRLQFGVVELAGDGERVSGFHEKPIAEHWINGGFFCFGQGLFDHLSVDSVLEREPLAQMAAAGELRARRHGGFWECMDTYKDAVALDDMWRSGDAPWRVWE